jgi:DNA-binding NarL/FixJ family response regulator
VSHRASRLDPPTLARLRTAVRAAQATGPTLPRAEVLAVHAATPPETRLTVDLAATAELGMPLLVVQVPIGPRPSPVLRALTPREFEVVGLVAAGFANKEIAVRLGVETSTIKEHVHRALGKTGLPNRAALARAYVGGDAADAVDREAQFGGEDR